MIPDGDEGGNNGLFPQVSKLYHNSEEVFVYSLPEGSDPDEILTEMGAEGFLTSVKENSKPAYVWQVQSLFNKHLKDESSDPSVSALKAWDRAIKTLIGKLPEYLHTAVLRETEKLGYAVVTKSEGVIESFDYDKAEDSPIKQRLADSQVERGEALFCKGLLNVRFAQEGTQEKTLFKTVFDIYWYMINIPENLREDFTAKLIIAAVDAGLTEVKASQTITRAMETAHQQTLDKKYKFPGKVNPTNRLKHYLTGQSVVLDVREDKISIDGQCVTSEQFHDGLETITNVTWAAKTVKRVLTVMAEKNERDRFKEWLEDIEPNTNEALIEELLQDAMGVTTDLTLAKGWLRVLVCGIIKRTFKPGSKHRMCPIFNGSQDSGKSGWLDSLLPWEGLKGEAHIGKKSYSDPTTKIGLHQRFAILEIPEIDQHFSQMDSSEVKTEISTHEDYGRKAYAADANFYPRRSTFFATTNHMGIANDSTGTTRFVVIETSKNLENRIDFDFLEQNRDEIWGWAMHFYLADPRHCNELTTAEKLQSERQNKEKYRHVSTLEDSLENFIAEIEPDCAFKGSDLNNALGRPNKTQEREIAAILRNHGFERGQKRIEGKPVRVWKRGSGDKIYSRQVISSKINNYAY
ncbi:VapE domain-containing protein [Egbenema bharatensis]|uniref:VapE domain-containing protein n=1 Tax=Egbenema bharatensis TaxID=3463334 RepID=UPI003A8A6E17